MTDSYANASTARQALSSLRTAIIWHPLLNCTFSSIPRREEKKGPALIESYGSWTLCMWTSVRSIFLSSIAVFLSVFPCYVTPFFSASDPWPSRFHLLSVLLMCFAFLLLFAFLSFVSLIFVIVHVQASLTQWICLKKKKKDFSCWSHAKHFEMPLKYGRCFLNALYSFSVK